jgi:quinol-cytochrome oxidoreductase complex cytochrome b subunit
VVANMMDYVPVVGGLFENLLLGGDRLGDQSLVRFYALHVAVLPALAALTVALHLWRVRRDGLATDGAERETVSAWPHMLAREAALITATSAAMVWLAVLVAAPLGPPADPALPANPEKAPWYFLGVQEMVSHSATLGGVVLPLVALGLLLVMPYLARDTQQTGGYFGNPEERRALGWTAVVATAAWVAAQVTFSRPAVEVWIAEQPAALGEWATPTGVVLAGAAVAFLWAGWRTRTNRAALHAALIVLVVAFVGSTLVGAMRGPDWQLFWPWQEWPGVR